jgi:hypothetical protein
MHRADQANVDRQRPRDHEQEQRHAYGFVRQARSEIMPPNSSTSVSSDRRSGVLLEHQ